MTGFYSFREKHRTAGLPFKVPFMSLLLNLQALFQRDLKDVRKQLLRANV